jgi:hypothetical protein
VLMFLYPWVNLGGISSSADILEKPARLDDLPNVYILAKSCSNVPVVYMRQSWK